MHFVSAQTHTHLLNTTDDDIWIRLDIDEPIYTLTALWIAGAIDGCHIKIQRPHVRGGDYLNRKGYYSVVLQAVVDDIFVGAPGNS